MCLLWCLCMTQCASLLGTLPSCGGGSAVFSQAQRNGKSYSQQSLAFFFVLLLHNPAPTSVLLPLCLLPVLPSPSLCSVHFLSISSLVSQRAGVANSLKFLQESPGNSEKKKNVKEENSYYLKDDEPRRQHSNVNPKTILTPSENSEEGLESRKGLLSF